MKIELHDVNKTPEGYLKGRARVTGVSVLDYTQTHGVSIFRPEAEVFDAASLDSLKGIPLTLGHPPANVTASNAQQWAIGATGSDVQREGESVTVDFTVYTDWIADEVYKRHTSGQRVEFSVGARGLPEYRDGEHKGQGYQAVLRNIRYNHLALLLDEPGRYPMTEITDNAEMLCITDAQLLTATINKPEVTTVKIKLPNGFEIDVADSEASYLQNHITEHEHLKTQLSEAQGSLKAAEKQLNDAADQIMTQDAIEQTVSARLALALEAKPLLDSMSVQELAKMTDRQIHEAVLLNDGYSADELQAEDAATVRGMYRQLVKAKGSAESQTVLDAAGKAKPAADPNVIQDSFGVAVAKLAEKMENKRKGVK
jgi:uncharacterized protein